MVSTISSAPPESARSLPNIAPSAIRVPTPAAVLPKPLVKLSTASVIGTPATAATASEPTVSAEEGVDLEPGDQQDDQRHADQGRGHQAPGGDGGRVRRRQRGRREREQG